MSRLHFELPSGAAGDMIFGSLVDCGANFDYVVHVLKKLKIKGWSIGIEDVVRAGITAKKIRIIDNSESVQKQLNEHKHSHDKGHKHFIEHKHEHSHAHRHLSDMLAVLDNPDLSLFVREKAAEIFNLLAEAEGEVHGMPKEEVHFHEVSGIDTIIDVIGSLLAVESMEVERISASEVAVGSGTIKCAHGTMPVPAPATIKIIQKKSIPIYYGDINTELLTPTGAAILGVLCEEFGKFSGGSVESVGYGAGDNDFDNYINAVRVIKYTKDISSAIVSDEILEIRFAIDDVTGEELGLFQGKLQDIGILDCYALPAVMKKSRGGFEVVILLRISDRARVENIIFSNGLTLGFRIREVGRAVLERAVEEVNVFGHPVKVKLGMYKGKIVSKKAEFEDCRKIAEVTGNKFIEIKRQAEGKL